MPCVTCRDKTFANHASNIGGRNRSFQTGIRLSGLGVLRRLRVLGPLDFLRSEVRKLNNAFDQNRNGEVARIFNMALTGLDFH